MKLLNALRDKMSAVIEEAREINAAKRRIKYDFLGKGNELVKTVDGVNVFVNNDLITVVCGVNVPGAYVPVNGNGEAIVINDLMFSSPHLDAVIAHELGHIKHKHQISKHYNLCMATGLGSDMLLEYEADDYAKAQGHDILATLKWLRDTWGFKQRSVIKRINRLESMK